MFGLLKKKKKYAPAYVDFYIVLNGNHDVEIYGLMGISLKKVERDVYTKHEGLGYWISSQTRGENRYPENLRKMSQAARVDLFDLVYGKKLKTIEGIRCG